MTHHQAKVGSHYVYCYQFPDEASADAVNNRVKEASSGESPNAWGAVMYPLDKDSGEPWLQVAVADGELPAELWKDGTPRPLTDEETDWLMNRYTNAALESFLGI